MISVPFEIKLWLATGIILEWAGLFLNNVYLLLSGATVSVLFFTAWVKIKYDIFRRTGIKQ